MEISTVGLDFNADTQIDVGLPAAEYVRMSTDHQKYSTENQSQAIHDYALRRGFKIEKTYADTGKSGLIQAKLEVTIVQGVRPLKDKSSPSPNVHFKEQDARA
jgi:hypothetical protein